MASNNEDCGGEDGTLQLDSLNPDADGAEDQRQENADNKLLFDLDKRDYIDSGGDRGHLLYSVCCTEEQNATYADADADTMTLKTHQDAISLEQHPMDDIIFQGDVLSPRTYYNSFPTQIEIAASADRHHRKGNKAEECGQTQNVADWPRNVVKINTMSPTCRQIPASLEEMLRFPEVAASNWESQEQSDSSNRKSVEQFLQHHQQQQQQQQRSQQEVPRKQGRTGQLDAY